jgi:4-amino-4-deoxy-L-arabinose transferase-like glycosyltransferase
VVLWASRTFARGGFAELLGAYRESTWLAQRHPPLGPAVFGSALWALGDSPFAIRLVTAAFAATTAGATAFIARALYGDAVARRAGWLLVTFPLFVRLGGAVMTDVVVTCLMVVAIALALDRARHGGRNAGVWLGLLLGAAVLVKYTAVLAVPVVVAAYAFHGALLRRRSELLVALLVLALPFLAWIGVAYAIGTLSKQIEWLSRVAGVSLRGVAGGFSAKEILLTKLPSGVGLYNVPWLAFGAVAMWRRGALAAGWLVAWALLVCVPLLLTLPDNRYFLPAFPVFAIVGALGVERIFARPERALWLALLLGAVTVVFYAVMPDRDPVFLFGTPPWMRR